MPVATRKKNPTALTVGSLQQSKQKLTTNNIITQNKFDIKIKSEQTKCPECSGELYSSSIKRPGEPFIHYLKCHNCKWQKENADIWLEVTYL